MTQVRESPIGWNRRARSSSENKGRRPEFNQQVKAAMPNAIRECRTLLSKRQQTYPSEHFLSQILARLISAHFVTDEDHQIKLKSLTTVK